MCHQKLEKVDIFRLLSMPHTHSLTDNKIYSYPACLKFESRNVKYECNDDLIHYRKAGPFTWKFSFKKTLQKVASILNYKSVFRDPILHIFNCSSSGWWIGIQLDSQSADIPSLNGISVSFFIFVLEICRWIHEIGKIWCNFNGNKDKNKCDFYTDWVFLVSSWSSSKASLTLSFFSCVCLSCFPLLSCWSTSFGTKRERRPAAQPQDERTTTSHVNRSASGICGYVH